MQFKLLRASLGLGLVGFGSGLYLLYQRELVRHYKQELAGVTDLKLADQGEADDASR